MPPKDSIIPSPAARSAVIAAVMLLLLAGSLGLSWAVTGAPLRPPGVPTAPAVPIAGATLSLPAAWVLESSTPQGAGPEILQWTFINQASTAERLRVIRFEVPQAVDEGDVLGKLLPQLLAGRRIILNSDSSSQWYRYERKIEDAGNVIDAVFSTQRLARVNTAPQLHAVRLLTPDRKNFWVFQLTDQVPAEQWNRDLEVSHIEQLRRMLVGLAYDAAS